MNQLSRNCVTILGMLLILSMANEAVGQSGISAPASTLTFDKTLDLPIAPTNIAVRDQFTYVMGDSDGVYQILQLDSATMQIVSRSRLQVVPENLILSLNGAKVYVVGKRGENSELDVLDSSLELLGQVSLSRPLAYPMLSLTENDMLVIAGMKTPKNEGGVIVVNVSDPVAPSEVEPTIPQSYGTLSATGAWLDNRKEPVTFLNLSLRPELLAYIGSKDSPQIRGFAIKYYTPEVEVTHPRSLAIHAVVADRNCRVDAKHASFLVAPPTNDVLFLLSFDEDFRSMDVVTIIPTAPPSYGDVQRETYPDSEILLPEVLLDSSCDKGVIWLGNRYSSDIQQFAFNTEVRLFEKVGRIKLSEPPFALAVGKSGRTAFTISKRAKTISRFQSGNGVVLGGEAQRELQRLLTERGYLVSAIDGVIGKETMLAVARFEKINNIKLNINGDLRGAIQAIKSVPGK